MVLAMLKQALSSLATVTTAAGRSRCPLRAVDESLSFWSATIACRGMDGRQLVENSRAVPPPPESQSFFSPARPDITEKLSGQGLRG